MSAQSKFVIALTLFTGLLAAAATVVYISGPALATEPLPGGVGSAFDPSIGFLAAALTTSISSIAAGFAVAHVGAAAIGAITEKPELLGRMLILVGLAEGIAIYGLIVSILILNRLG